MDIQIGTSDPLVAQAREALRSWGYAVDDSSSETFDEALQAVVIAFQTAQSLLVTGALDDATLAGLGVGVGSTAADLGAQAFTGGTDIHFGGDSGTDLLTHEVSHIEQQQ